MSWTLTANDVSAALPNPNLGDTYQHVRRQAAIASDGGQIWVQDLCVEDEFLFVTWRGLGVTVWSQLLKVLRAANWQGDPIEISVSSEQPFPVGIAPGMEVEGVGVAPGQGWAPGDVVSATSFTLKVFLDQDSAEFEHQASCYGVTALRFRIAPLTPLEAA